MKVETLESWRAAKERLRLDEEQEKEREERFKAGLQDILDDITMPYTDFDIEVGRNKLRAVLDRL